MHKGVSDKPSPRHVMLARRTLYPMVGDDDWNETDMVRVTKALAQVEERARAEERAAVVRYLRRRGGRLPADWIEAGRHLTEEE